MSEVAESAESPRRGLLRPLAVGLGGAVALGGAVGLAAFTGVLDGLPLIGRTDPAAAPPPIGDVVFLELEPMVISLAAQARHRHLRFSATLEVARGHQSDVTRLTPRILDVLNSYLRAVDPAEFDEPALLFRMRAQMLRRVRLVTGEERVRDILITEFVLN